MNLATKFAEETSALQGKTNLADYENIIADMGRDPDQDRLVIMFIDGSAFMMEGVQAVSVPSSLVARILIENTSMVISKSLEQYDNETI